MSYRFTCETCRFRVHVKPMLSHIVFVLHVQKLHVPVNTLRFYLCVCLSVCDGCGRGHNKFAGRVQNYRVPCAKLSLATCAIHRNFLEIVKAAAGQDTQSCRLREGCHCGRLSSH